MKLVYIGGPFSAPTRAGVDENVARAVQLGIEVAKLGACPWIPHANTAHPDFEHVQPYDFWIKATLAQLRKCDGIILTPDWQLSSGARGEHADALAREQPIFYSVSDLAAWLSELRRLGVQ